MLWEAFPQLRQHLLHTHLGRAANISKQSAEDSKSFTRAQLYMSHRQDFVELVDYLSNELDIVFVRKYELYQRLFPRNHYSGNHFDADGSPAVLDGWAKRYQAIVELTDHELSEVELDFWIMECGRMGEDLQFEFKPQKGLKIFLFGDTPSDSINTGFTFDPARQVFYFGEVINRIYAFCGRQSISPLLMDGHDFQIRFKEYFIKIKSGQTRHRVGDPGAFFEATR
ncbi:hypothetical protein AB7M23_004064 [Pseudomonas sp. HLS-6 TE3448]